MQDPRQVGLLTFPLSLCVHWAVLFLFCNGFFCGKLTFCLNRSNSHWALVLSLHGLCTSLKVMSAGQEYDWGCGVYFPKEGLSFTVLNYLTKTASWGYAEEYRYLLCYAEESRLGHFCQTWGAKLIFQKYASDCGFLPWFPFWFFNERPNMQF